jgi:hypothetical protein
MPAPDSTSHPLRERLERAADGLVYSSEGDNPFEYVAADAPGGARSESAEELAAILAGREEGDRVEERSLDDFFKRHIETSDPYDSRAQAIRPRYEALQELLRSSLSGVRVIRLTRAANRAVVRCFVVGRDRAGRIVGLATSAIET